MPLAKRPYCTQIGSVKPSFTAAAWICSGAGGLADVARGEVVGRGPAQARDEEEDGEDDRRHDDEQDDGADEAPDHVSQHGCRPGAVAVGHRGSPATAPAPSPTFGAVGVVR